jgi:hypothetical protein
MISSSTLFDLTVVQNYKTKLSLQKIQFTMESLILAQDER